MRKIPSLLPNSKLSKTEISSSYSSFPDLKFFSSTEYMSRVGALMYLAKRTRPDIAAVAGYLARRQCNFTRDDCIHLQRIFAYLYLTRNHYLDISGGNLAVSTFVDADWAGDILDRSCEYISKLPKMI